jgi:NAD dependent epimerase/dehydratase
LCWRGRLVLVTGAGGFIGSHLSEALVDAGANVRALVHYNALGSRGWLDRSPKADAMQIIAGDVCDRESVQSAVDGCSIVFHLAALIGIPYSYNAPASYVRTNIEGTLNILQAAREQGVKRVVHTSTSEVYGSARYTPIDEAHPLQAQSPYAATKIGADKIAEAFYLSFGLPVVTVRPFNTFGPSQSARAVIPSILAQCLNSETIQLGSVTPTRDFNFISDTVDGFLKAGCADAVFGETINLGSGRETSIADVAKLIASVTGREINLNEDPARVRPRASEIERLVADNSKARRLLGWQPRVTLEEGIARTAEWMLQHQDRFRPGVYTV